MDRYKSEEKLKHDSILDFWFKELTPKDWFSGSQQVDALLRERFLETHTKAAACELYGFRATPEGRLAEVLILDQFSRNIHRNTPLAFATDALALALAQEAVSLGADKVLPLAMRAFLYMPYMHSESLLIHVQAVKLFSQTGMENNLDFEMRHKAIIEKFGRYPHRNYILGRASTPQEIEFLKLPGSGF